jgi:hypothetical protein
MLCHTLRFNITTHTIMRRWWSAALVHARHTHDKDLFVEEVLVFLGRPDLSPGASTALTGHDRTVVDHVACYEGLCRVLS